MFYIYFLQSTKNGKIYTGFTNKKPSMRLAEHNNGSNKWTSENGPFKLIYFESYHCKKDAIAREKFYKSGFGKNIRSAILAAISNGL